LHPLSPFHNARRHAIEETIYAIRVSYLEANPDTTDGRLRDTMRAIDMLSREQFKNITLLNEVKKAAKIR
jgi:hypothetical protein